MKLSQRHFDSFHLSPVTQVTPRESLSPSVTVVTFPSVVVVRVQILIHIKLVLTVKVLHLRNVKDLTRSVYNVEEVVHRFV